MERLISCEFNMDTACVELKFADGSMISIDTIAVENEIADNMYQRSELDYLIYNDPIAYADLILNGNPEIYLKTITEYESLDYVKTASSGTLRCRDWRLFFTFYQSKQTQRLADLHSILTSVPAASAEIQSKKQVCCLQQTIEIA